MNTRETKISIVVSDLSAAVALRAYLLAQALNMLGYRAEIIGGLTRDELFAGPPKEISQKVVATGRRFPAFFASAAEFLKEIDGDIVYALKPRVGSFGLALFKKVLSGRPLILDIDDWEVGLFANVGSHYRPTLSTLNHPLYLGLMEQLIGQADAVTAHTSFLTGRFGGFNVPNGKDTDVFDPSRFDIDSAKADFGLSGYKVLMFPGVAKIHKGLQDIIEALHRLNRDDIKLVIVGSNPYNQREERLLENGKRWIVSLPRMPVSTMPEIVAAADVVVVPQRDTPWAQAQFPLKLTDGMAMAKPVLSTYVGDIPKILGDCGYLVHPQQPGELAEMIDHILSHPEEAREKGKRARHRCMEHYSLTAMAESLRPVFEQIESSKQSQGFWGVAGAKPVSEAKLQ